MVLATSYLEEAERAAHVLVLDAGRALSQGTPAEITATTVGAVYASVQRPVGEVAMRAWRQGSGWRIWSPDGSAPSGHDAERVAPDLADAVIAATLARQDGSWDVDGRAA